MIRVDPEGHREWVNSDPVEYDEYDFDPNYMDCTIPRESAGIKLFYRKWSRNIRGLDQRLRKI